MDLPGSEAPSIIHIERTARRTDLPGRNFSHQLIPASCVIAHAIPQIAWGGTMYRTQNGTLIVEGLDPVWMHPHMYIGIGARHDDL
jgi:hypothetical protein